MTQKSNLKHTLFLPLWFSCFQYAHCHNILNYFCTLYANNTDSRGIANSKLGHFHMRPASAIHADICRKSLDISCLLESHKIQNCNELRNKEHWHAKTHRRRTVLCRHLHLRLCHEEPLWDKSHQSEDIIAKYVSFIDSLKTFFKYNIILYYGN